MKACDWWSDSWFCGYRSAPLQRPSLSVIKQRCNGQMGLGLGLKRRLFQLANSFFQVVEALHESEQVLQDMTDGLFGGHVTLCPLLH